MSEWTVVKRKCRKHIVKNKIALYSYKTNKMINATTSSLSEPIENVVLTKTISVLATHFEGTAILSRCLNTILENFVSFSYVIAMGVGSFKSSSSSRLQLSFILSLRDKLNTAFEKPLISYSSDPCFSDEELEITNSVEFVAVRENKFLRELIPKPAIFFMPHCPYQLYNYVLWQYWGRSLFDIVIIGNRYFFSESWFVELLKI